MMRSKTILLSLVVSMLLLFSCKVGPDYARQASQVPGAFSQDFPSDSSIANIPWWELFRDTVLVDLIRLTMENNKDLKSALARVEEARAAIGIVRADLYPRINYAVGGSSSVNTAAAGITNEYAGAVDVSYTLDFWGRVKRLSEAALQDYLATEEAYRALRIMLLSEVAMAYLTLRDLDNRLSISEKTAETWKSNLSIVQARYKGGFVSEVDLNQANIQLLEAQTAIQSFTRLRKQTENIISLLMGKAPARIPRGLTIEEQLFPPELPAGVPSELLDRRPDILMAERQLNAQTERIGAAEALKYPSFTISLSTGMNFLNPLAGFASLGAQILGPIFNSKSTRLKVEMEKERTDQLLFNYENTFLKALREVEDAMIAVSTFRSELTLRKEQLRSAQAAVKLSWIRYEGGLTSYLEVLDLQRSLFSSELKASETLQMQLTSTVKLYQALGGGWMVPDDSLHIK